MPSFLFNFLLICSMNALTALKTNGKCSKLKKNHCSCVMDDGREIDLSAITSPTDWTFSATDKNNFGVAQFYYNPCFPFTVSNAPNCSNVALCKYNTTKNTISLPRHNVKKSQKLYSDLGDFDNFQFLIDPNKMLYIHYNSTRTAGKKIESFVYLVCNKTTSFSINSSESNSTHYKFMLHSPCTCANGCLPPNNTVYLSTGTVILIFFFVFLVTYCVVGVLYNKAVEGASGKDLIPNRTMWSSLPGLIKDGYCFFISPCTGRPVEYRSYEKL